MYGLELRGPTGLIALPSPARADVQAAALMESVRATHEVTRLRIEQATANYKAAAGRGRRVAQFESGEFVWAVLTRDRYLAHEYNKLAARKVGPLEILEKYCLNAYRLRLLSHLRTWNVFNVKHLIPYTGDNDETNFSTLGSRANLFSEG